MEYKLSSTILTPFISGKNLAIKGIITTAFRTANNTNMCPKLMKVANTLETNEPTIRPIAYMKDLQPEEVPRIEVGKFSTQYVFESMNIPQKEPLAKKPAIANTQ